jgi:hypothetical protein
MAVSEADLELLDSHLDNELTNEEAAALDRRLTSEPDLADTLEQLRIAREARVKFFDGLEPDGAAVQRLTASVHRAVNKELLWTKRARALRTVSGIAACLLVGFGGGYLFRGQPGTGPGMSTAGPSVGPAPMVSGVPSRNRDIYFPPVQPANVAVLPAGGASTASGNSNNLVGYEVSLTDDAGNVIGVQRFPTLEQARDFANSVTRWGRQHNQLQNGGVRVIGDQF